MGGVGSGRHKYATTATVEECHTLKINALSDLTKQPGMSASYQWFDEYNDEDEVASVGVRAIRDGQPVLAGGTDPDRENVRDALEGRATHFQLKYAVTPPAGETNEYAYRVLLEYTAVHFGGVRPWFRCPACDDRVGTLHRPPGEDVFQCRGCFDLGYTSSRLSGNEVRQAELRYRRAFAKADAKDRRPHPNREPWAPERPKGMHHETFEQLTNDVAQAREEWKSVMVDRTQDLIDWLS